MRFQIVDGANFKVAEQFTDPSDGTLKTTGTMVLRIFEIDWATPALAIYEWTGSSEAFVTSSPTDDEGTMTHYQAAGIDTGIWISPAIVYTAFTAGNDYIFQFANETDTVYQTYEVRYQGAAMWVNVEQIDGDATAAANLKTAGDNYSATRGFAGTALPAAAADAAGGLPISDAGGLDLDAKLAATNEVTAARMGALTDWINGGRLDLLLDAIKAVTDALPDSGALSSLAQASALATAQADLDTLTGTDGVTLATSQPNYAPATATALAAAQTDLDTITDTGVTATDLATQAKADVNAECDTALSDYGANTTTPPTAAANATALLAATVDGIAVSTILSRTNARVRGKFTLVDDTLTFFLEDGSTESFALDLTAAGGDPA